MRNVSVALRVVAVVAVFTVSAVGQEVLIYSSTSVDLPLEPVHLQTNVTLAEAAQRNDFPTFDALYNESRDGAYAELHDFWKWSLTDPIGAFYGTDMHAKLAAEYPDYSAFIADYRIVDSHGNSFYPSSETRQFLLRHAMTVIAPVTTRVAVVKPVHKAHRRVEKPVPLPAQPRVSAVAVVPAPKPQPSVAAGASPTSDARGARRHTAAPTPVAAPRVDDARFARGLALIIAGLIGVGMLTLMLRTPAEERESEAQEEADPMEPLRIFKLEREPKKDTESHSSVA